MQNQVRHQLSLVGLQRTGTNYVEQVLRATLQDVQLNFTEWKHAFRDETDSAKIGADVVIVARHPVLWLQSCLLNSPKDIRESRSECFAGVADPVIGFANVYNGFYEGWLDHKSNVGGYILRYEALVEGGSSALNEVFLTRFKVVDASRELPTAPMSVQLSREDLEAVANRECSISEETAAQFWAHLTPDVVAGLGYTFEEISFSASLSEARRLRAAAYKLTDNTEPIADEEFQLLLRVGRETFQHDGRVLGEVGTKLFKDGDVDGAFDWLVQAVQTIRQIENKIYRVQLDSSLADYLELLSRACLVTRERALVQLKEHYDRVKPKNGHCYGQVEMSPLSKVEMSPFAEAEGGRFERGRFGDERGGAGTA